MCDKTILNNEYNPKTLIENIKCNELFFHKDTETEKIFMYQRVFLTDILALISNDCDTIHLNQLLHSKNVIIALNMNTGKCLRFYPGDMVQIYSED